MSDAHAEELLSAYLEGELDESRAAEVGRHLASCPNCRLLVESMKDAREALGALPEVEPSPALLQRLYAIPEKKRFRLVPDFLLRPSLQPLSPQPPPFLSSSLSWLSARAAGRSRRASTVSSTSATAKPRSSTPRPAP